MPIRVRIAPSPTGDPHVGTAYIALFNYVFAKKSGGKFILRIEDTDRTRSTKESEDAILRALKWVGLQWDEGPDVGGPHGPYRQSERAAIYAEHAQKLLASGAAYPCFCTEARLAELREKQRVEKKPGGYDGLCREIPAADARARIAAGERHVVRLAMPHDGTTIVNDGIRGEVSFDNATVDDQVLLKSDGFPTYHLANVVDDHLMEITHVVRAEEWITSTPKHLQLYRAFGWEPPAFFHMSLLRNPDKSKISKRKNPVSLDYYRDSGYLPFALLNFLGLMGFSYGNDREKFTLDEMIEAFDWSKVRASAPVFGLDKLSWLNGLYLRELPVAELLAHLRAWRLGDEFLLRLLPLVQERIERLDQLIPSTDFFFGDQPLDLKPLEKDNPDKKILGKRLALLIETLDALRSWDKKSLEETFRKFCDEQQWEQKPMFMTLRYLVTYRTATPPLFETLELIGAPIVRERLRAAVRLLK